MFCAWPAFVCWLGFCWAGLLWVGLVFCQFSGFDLSLFFGFFSLWIGALFWVLVFCGEFDPGSGRTLAACLTHASRTMKLGTCIGWISGERVSNT